MERRHGDEAQGTIGHKDEGLDRELGQIYFERPDEPVVKPLSMSQVTPPVVVLQGQAEVPHDALEVFPRHRYRVLF